MRGRFFRGLSNALAVVWFVGLLASSLALFVLSGDDAAGVPPSFREGRWLFLPVVIVGRAVILVPSLSLGVREEIFEICQGSVRHKLIVCVPPDVASDIAADV